MFPLLPPTELKITFTLMPTLCLLTWANVSIIRSLLHSPAILIMDEPETGLDQESVSLLRNFIISFAETGGIAVIASHTSEVDYGEDQKRYHISNGRLLKGS